MFEQTQIWLISVVRWFRYPVTSQTISPLLLLSHCHPLRPWISLMIWEELGRPSHHLAGSCVRGDWYHSLCRCFLGNSSPAHRRVCLFLLSIQFSGHLFLDPPLALLRKWLQQLLLQQLWTLGKRADLGPCVWYNYIMIWCNKTMYMTIYIYIGIYIYIHT